jgi:hypothetical protein
LEQLKVLSILFDKTEENSSLSVDALQCLLNISAKSNLQNCDRHSFFSDTEFEEISDSGAIERIVVWLQNGMLSTSVELLAVKVLFNLSTDGESIICLH